MRNLQLEGYASNVKYEVIKIVSLALFESKRRLIAFSTVSSVEITPLSKPLSGIRG